MIGGWWIEPDCNIPAGESFVRQALYGQRYLLDKFGIIATTGANLDSFGHNATHPADPARAAAWTRTSSYAPGPKENPQLPGPLFWWESPDGSQRPRLSHPPRVLRAEGRHRRTRREGDCVAARRPRGSCRLLRRRQPRRRPDPRQPRPDRASWTARGAPQLRVELAAAVLRRGRRGGRPPDVAGRAAAPRARLLHDAFRDQALEPPRGEPPAQRAEKWSAIADHLGAQPYPLDAADGGLEAPALQPVPRHARRYLDRARLRGCA